MSQKNVKLLKIFVLLAIGCARCTIDMNMSEFQYIADHLHSEECRRLIAALHFDSFETPNALNQAETRVSHDVPCLQQLLHWNRENGGGKSESHEFVSRRLDQIGRQDLASWLTKSSYEALGHDFERRARDSFKRYEPLHLPPRNISTKSTMPSRITMATTAKYAPRRIIKQSIPAPANPEMPPDPTEWTIFDTISWTMVIVLFLVVIFLMIYLTLSSPCCRGDKKKSKRNRLERLDEDDYYNSPYISPMYKEHRNRTPKIKQKHSILALTDKPTIPYKTMIEEDTFGSDNNNTQQPSPSTDKKWKCRLKKQEKLPVKAEKQQQLPVKAEKQQQLPVKAKKQQRNENVKKTQTPKTRLVTQWTDPPPRQDEKVRKVEKVKDQTSSNPVSVSHCKEPDKIPARTCYTEERSSHNDQERCSFTKPLNRGCMRETEGNRCAGAASRVTFQDDDGNNRNHYTTRHVSVPGAKPQRASVVRGLKTIDIHQKIAIPIFHEAAN